ncbi:MAG: TIM barrel protein [Candidatus Latescibacteria bacterium]|nr:TIM barrel protein [Candidatus Latescibacterota bacterium]
MEYGFNPERRNFVKAAFAGVFGSKILQSGTVECRVEKNNAVPHEIEPGIKLALIVNGIPDEDQLTFIRQLGIEYIEAWLPGREVTYTDILNYRNKVEAAGLQLFSTDILDAYNSDQFILGLPGRDQKIKQLQEFIRNLGKAGLHTTTYGFGAGSVYSTGVINIRGCDTRLFDLEEARKKSLAYGRVYSEEEVWDNYEYFIKRVLPVAEDAGVRLAMHPCDPPVSLRGCPRLFSSRKAFERAMEIANHSKYSGISFCVGTWGEMAGPDGKGEDVIGAIRHFGKTGHIFTVHFRNVSSPLPRFHETFVDNGYIDMSAVMKTLAEVGFNGTVVPDHVPHFKDEKRLGHISASGTAYTIGYMRALLQ